MLQHVMSHPSTVLEYHARRLIRSAHVRSDDIEALEHPLSLAIDNIMYLAIIQRIPCMFWDEHAPHLDTKLTFTVNSTSG